MKKSNLKEATFKHDGKNFKVELRHTVEFTFNKCRAYVWDAPKEEAIDFDKEIMPIAKKLGLDSIYTKKGEHPEIDKAFKALNKRVVAAKTELLKAGLKKIGLSPDG